jgi:predicted DNA-binding protein (UPF0251 family)
MPRPHQPRRIARRHQVKGFRPIGRPAFDLPVVTVGLDEIEALRLADLEGLYQEAAAERMAISRATFARILARARRTVAEALIGEKVLLVSAGPVVEGQAEPEGCPVHWGGRRRGRGCHCQRDPGDSGPSTMTKADHEDPEGGNDAGI